MYSTHKYIQTATFLFKLRIDEEFDVTKQKLFLLICKYTYDGRVLSLFSQKN